MVNQDAETPAGRGGEARHDGGEVVDPLQVLHHDPHLAQVIAPDLLHQLGIVLAFHEDAAGPGHLGPAGWRRHRPRGGPRPPGLAAAVRRSGRDEGDRLTVQQEGRWGEREHPPLAAAVFERHRALLVTDHRAAEPPLGVLHHQVALGLDLRHFAGGPPAR